jgi:GMP synthase PP-ATPase subunit
MGLNVKGVDSGDRFLSGFTWVSDPETSVKLLAEFLLKF